MGAWLQRHRGNFEVDGQGQLGIASPHITLVARPPATSALIPLHEWFAQSPLLHALRQVTRYTCCTESAVRSVKLLTAKLGARKQHILPREKAGLYKYRNPLFPLFLLLPYRLGNIGELSGLHPVYEELSRAEPTSIYMLSYHTTSRTFSLSPFTISSLLVSDTSSGISQLTLT